MVSLSALTYLAIFLTPIRNIKVECISGFLLFAAISVVISLDPSDQPTAVNNVNSLSQGKHLFVRYEMLISLGPHFFQFLHQYIYK